VLSQRCAPVQAFPGRYPASRYWRTAQDWWACWKRATLNRRALSNLLFADIATAQELLRQVGSLNIDLIVQKPEDKAAIAAMLPTGVKLETAEAQKNAVQQMTAAFELNLTALSWR